MFLYNTLTRKKEKFVTIEDRMVRFYQCGPTVYWTQHIGNLRAMTIGDLLVRSLKYLGYQVKFVRNYTDVGHLTSDADTGEDKMEKGAKREGLTPQAIASKYIQIFERDTKLLNLIEPDYKPRATETIEEIKQLIQVLLDKGYAYITDLAIYYDVSKFKNYTQLSKQKLMQQYQGAGKADVEDANKRHPADFALWFFKKGKHKGALQTWNSAWGEGFPGWHIECSAMSKKFLGDTLDIHMGGVEHIPVHHTNEIAQSEAANGVKFVNYWLHNEHLLVDGKKMAKSGGTAYSLQEVIDKIYKDKRFHPLDLRYFFLQAHYRSQQNFTWEALAAASTSRLNLLRLVFVLKQKAKDKKGKILTAWKNLFVKALEDDLNIPQALAVVWELLATKERPEDIIYTLYDFDKVLGLKIKDLRVEIPEKVIQLANRRQELRAEGQYREADELRLEVERAGYIIEDTQDGFVLTPKKI